MPLLSPQGSRDGRDGAGAHQQSDDAFFGCTCRFQDRQAPHAEGGIQLDGGDRHGADGPGPLSAAPNTTGSFCGMANSLAMATAARGGQGRGRGVFPFVHCHWCTSARP